MVGFVDFWVRVRVGRDALDILSESIPIPLRESEFGEPSQWFFLVHGYLRSRSDPTDPGSFAPSYLRPTMACELTRPVSPSSVKPFMRFLGDAGMNHRNARLAIGERV
jgi:hypothetical protein